MRELSSKQVKAAVLIGHGTPKNKAAEEVGVCPQTISLWGREEVFKGIISDIKHDMMIDARNKLRSLLPLAITQLRTIITSSESDSAKLKAIKMVLDQAKVAPTETGLWDFD